ncbi:hypothetical protein HID58_068699 [Brassica napus]|uniref:3-oxoacyl-[acyl-carrier-protein] reductase n=1 Tax=Brassica napus TaxID=3708 RepID=A0ABQ7ZMQ1_BRANA|nr:hypothetical protein HID58_068699 [Brassica napus]
MNALVTGNQRNRSLHTICASLLIHPLLKASGSGSIVFISSVAGVVSCSVGSIYGATKRAISQMARNLACE